MQDAQLSFQKFGQYCSMVDEVDGGAIISPLVALPRDKD